MTPVQRHTIASHYGLLPTRAAELAHRTDVSIRRVARDCKLPVVDVLRAYNAIARASGKPERVLVGGIS